MQKLPASASNEIEIAKRSKPVTAGLLTVAPRYLFS